MKASILRKIEDAKNRTTASGANLAPVIAMPRGMTASRPSQRSRAVTALPLSPLLVSDPFARQCLLEINEGKVYTLEDVQERLKLKPEAARRLFCNEPGVAKVNSMYRIPHCVFDKVMLGRLIQSRH